MIYQLHLQMAQRKFKYFIGILDLKLCINNLQPIIKNASFSNGDDVIEIFARKVFCLKLLHLSIMSHIASNIIFLFQ